MQAIKFLIIGFLFGGNALAFTTGTVTIPNDVVQGSREWRVDSRAFFTLDKRQSDTGAQAPFLDEGVTYGIFDNLTVAGETGLDWWEPESQDNLKCLHAHFKFSVHESEAFPGVSLGFYNFGFRSNATDENILYIGVGKTFGSIGHFFLGFGSGNQNVLVDETGHPANNALMFSWQDPAPFPSLSRNLSMMVDWQSSLSQEGAISVGFKWFLHPETSLLLGYDIYNNRHLQRDTFTMQLFVRL